MKEKFRTLLLSCSMRNRLVSTHIWFQSRIGRLFNASSKRQHEPTRISVHVSFSGCWVIIFPQLHISQIGDSQEEHDEMLMSCSMNEKLPHRKTLCKQPSSWKCQAPLVHVPILRWPIINFIKAQIPDSIQEKPLPQGQIHLPRWRGQCKTYRIAAIQLHL
ncbi:hypothetical protein OIU84_016592 [Salix udensis]|uniref:Uncharacterized protein n=1 Tax=Salix udensis TaxID=889485 RepID=A0AAD6JA16_9ROSI|nr:hypothetical protein OIU84_016592 [Salix udensis]